MRSLSWTTLLIIKTTSATMLTTLLKNSLPPKYGLWCPQVQNKSDLCLIVNLKQPMLKQYLKGRLTRLLQTAFSDPELNPITQHLKLCIPPRISPDRATLVFTATPTLIEAIKHRQPPYTACNIAGLIYFEKANDVRQKAKMQQQMANLSMDNITQ